MNDEMNKSEKGQAIVYLVLGLVVFLGFVALAIDGGMALADRRNVQNAADASSLAGAAAAAYHLEKLSNATCGYAWSCTNQVVIDARSNAVFEAKQRAQANGFTIDDNISDHNGVNTHCDVIEDPSIDVTVEMSATTPSNFLQLIFPNALRNEVEAVTLVRPGGPVAFGNAVVALNPEKCSDPGSQGVIVGGDAIVTVTGGDIFSNGCMRQNGQNDKTTVKVIGGDALYHYPFNLEPDKWDPDPQPTTKTIDPKDYEVKPPDCSDPNAHSVDGPQLGKTILTLQPGLNCITGNVTIESGKNLTGNDVTLYMINGTFLIRGGTEINLTAPPDAPSTYPAIPGILIYMPKTNLNDVTLNGSETSIISGFIYAPHNKVTLTGTGGNTYTGTQVLGWDVVFTGTSELKLIYSGCQGYIRPPKIELNK